MLRRINKEVLVLAAVLLAFNFIDGEFEDPRAWVLRILEMLPGIIVGLSFHEFAHGFVSYKLGDPTPMQQGRVTINPFAHIDPLGFLALIFCGFGWGIPVSINPMYYKHRRRDELLVAVAGVLMNFLVAIAGTFLLKALLGTGLGESENGQAVLMIFVYLVQINLVLMVFNLIPVPPLDGFGIVTQVFNLRRYDWYNNIYDKGFLILLVLIVFGITDRILSPCVNGLWELFYTFIIG